MKNGSAAELFSTVETVAGGKIYVNPLIAPLAPSRTGQSYVSGRGNFTSEVHPFAGNSSPGTDRDELAGVEERHRSIWNLHEKNRRRIV